MLTWAIAFMTKVGPTSAEVSIKIPGELIFLAMTFDVIIVAMICGVIFVLLDKKKTKENR